MKYKKNMKRNRAFSLIELMLVLVILSVLAALVAPRFIGTSEEGRVKAATVDLGTFKQALERFNIHCARFPTNTEGLKALIEDPGNASGWNGPYLDEDRVPKDPWGNEYNYEQPGKHRKDYDIYSNGPDGKVSNEDDITNWTKE